MSKKQNFSKAYLITDQVFSAVTHGIGIILAIIGAVFLLIKGFNQGNPLNITAYFIYAFTLFFLYANCKNKLATPWHDTVR